MKVEPWFKKLSERASKLCETLYAMKHPNAAVDAGGPDFSPDAIAKALRADAPPWQDAGSQERAEFAEARGGRALDEVTRVAFDPLASLVTENDRTNALVELIAWDLRYIGHPAVQAALRVAQVSNDQAFLRAVADALPKNERFASRGVRGQRLLTRLLHAFAFGDANAYADQAYRDRVYDELQRIFREADVPTTEPIWKALNDRNYFSKHLRRLGFFAET